MLPLLDTLGRSGCVEEGTDWAVKEEKGRRESFQRNLATFLAIQSNGRPRVEKASMKICEVLLGLTERANKKDGGRPSMKFSSALAQEAQQWGLVLLETIKERDQRILRGVPVFPLPLRGHRGQLVPRGKGAAQGSLPWWLWVVFICLLIHFARQTQAY